jgi:hypothetical protein
MRSCRAKNLTLAQIGASNMVRPVRDPFNRLLNPPSRCQVVEIPIFPRSSLEIEKPAASTYERTGNPRRVRRTSHDPLSPFNWAGTMWDSRNSGTFSLLYDDGSFSASGSFDSTGNFGEMGFERNGVFLNDDQGDDHNHAEAQPQSLSQANAPPQLRDRVAGSIPEQTARTVLLKGRVPVKVNF